MSEENFSIFTISIKQKSYIEKAKKALEGYDSLTVTDDTILLIAHLLKEYRRKFNRSLMKDVHQFLNHKTK